MRTSYNIGILVDLGREVHYLEWSNNWRTLLTAVDTTNTLRLPPTYCLLPIALCVLPPAYDLIWAYPFLLLISFFKVLQKFRGNFIP